ncbi:MAG: helix-turn-helix domain-containing protein [Oscillospiraceae bacterium]|nr:helix-turn-helix domain-containing protein [Oscillospiraceae bacterium]
MNIGEKILELRKQKGIKQEELAAELGVTAAAVSKWENGYTLPDILMLCALADFFGVTTDELLDRNKQTQYAVIVANEASLGHKIQELAARLGIQTKGICTQFADAVEIVRTDAQITHLLLGHLGADAPVIDFSLFASSQTDGQERKLIFYTEISDNEAEILSELERCLK